MVSFCPLCRLSMAFSRQVFPVSGSEGQREGQNQVKIRKGPGEASPHGPPLNSLSVRRFLLFCRKDSRLSSSWQLL